jgi:phosphoribosylformylglycinamidine (FGAM) synthase-like enzyme
MTRVTLNGEEVDIEMTKGEFEKVKELLDKEPNITELGMFDIMWSEHCSY